MPLSPTMATPIQLDEHIRPMMVVVVDTEEEFDWKAPFCRTARSTMNMREQHVAQTILNRFNATPLYVIDHPVATDPWAVGWLRELAADGMAEVGAHLHTWVTPPYTEVVSQSNSYGCNLDPALEREKIAALTDAVSAVTGKHPLYFRAGRYGVGHGTLESLRALGYRADLSIAPHSSFGIDGGPSFYGWCNDPVWHGEPGGLLGLPVTTGFAGTIKGWGPAIAPLLDAPTMRSLRIPGGLAKIGLLDRCRLTIEGVPTESLRSTMRSLVRCGHRFMTLNYHSSTIMPGKTKYAVNITERDALLAKLVETLEYFCDDLGGRVVSVSTAEREIRHSALNKFPALMAG